MRKMKKLIAILTISSLAGCAADQEVIKQAQGGSSLVYRHITPIKSEATIKFKSDDGKITSSLADPTWLTRLDYKGIAFGVSGIVHEITSPATFPFGLVLAAVDPVSKIFMQSSEVELKRLETQTLVEEESVWLPKSATRVSVKRGELEVQVEGK